MSRKYQRIKQQDLDLPAPVRWITRAFSSITMAVILLVLISIYGLVASVPAPLLAIGGILTLIALGVLAPAAWITIKLLSLPDTSLVGRAAGSLFVALSALGLTTFAIWQAIEWGVAQDWYFQHRGVVLYRLPWLEMTELQFYSWWPMRLLLVLFVCNMVWATIRRIEFTFENIGVLTVHAGIVLLALGSLFYGAFKVEGTMILFRPDLGGGPRAEFFDAADPAIYVLDAEGRRLAEAPMPRLPRYNDYAEGELAMTPGDPDFAEALGPGVEVRVVGLYPDAQLIEQPVPAPAAGPAPTASVAGRDRPGAPQPGPAMVLTPGSRETIDPRAPTAQLLAAQPARRVVDAGVAEIEYLHAPPPDRLARLLLPTPELRSLLVEIPDAGYQGVHPAEPGATFELGDTGYQLTVEEVGDYGLPFVSPGYRGARDTRAVVRFESPDHAFRRLVMHRYPEMSQDFLPDPDAGPMGRRTDPDPAYRVTFFDEAPAGGPKLQVRLVTGLDAELVQTLRDAAQADDPVAALTRLAAELEADEPPARSGSAAAPSDGPVHLLMRLPGMRPVIAEMQETAFPVGGEMWLHITDRKDRVVLAPRPVPTPPLERDPSAQPTHQNAVIGLEVTGPNPGGDGRWSKLLWIGNMAFPYPALADGRHAPVRLAIPTADNEAVERQIIFSRARHGLPFALQLEHFEMIPYPGTEEPRDYVSTLTVYPHDAPGDTFDVETRLNDPANVAGYKLSQTGWDPGDPADPRRFDRDADGLFLRQQRYTVLGVGNNVGIQVIFLGGVLITLGIPWAFYVKPALLRRRSRRAAEARADRRASHVATATGGPAEPDESIDEPAAGRNPVPAPEPREPASTAP